MEIDAFLGRVVGEPERIVTQTVWITPPAVLAQATKLGGMKLTDLLSAPGRRAEQREVRYSHVLGAHQGTEPSSSVWEQTLSLHRTIVFSSLE